MYKDIQSFFLLEAKLKTKVTRNDGKQGLHQLKSLFRSQYGTKHEFRGPRIKTLKGTLVMFQSNIPIFTEEEMKHLIKPITNKTNCLFFHRVSFKCHFTLTHLTIPQS